MFWHVAALPNHASPKKKPLFATKQKQKQKQMRKKYHKNYIKRKHRMKKTQAQVKEFTEGEAKETFSSFSSSFILKFVECRHINELLKSGL